MYPSVRHITVESTPVIVLSHIDPHVPFKRNSTRPELFEFPSTSLISVIKQMTYLKHAAMFTTPENISPFSQIKSHYTKLLLIDWNSVAVVVIGKLHTCMQYIYVDNVKKII